MLRSYVSFAARGDVVLRREIASQLGVGPNGVLYGALFPAESALILSQIPPSYWASALKIIVHTHSRPGSVAAVADAIADLGLNTISSWGSTESALGHICSTSIVVPDDHSETDDSNHLREELLGRLTRHLTDVPVFADGTLQTIRVTPLAILQAYSKELINADYHRVRITHHSLGLGSSTSLESPNSGTLWDQLLTALEVHQSSACILTPDTEEAFLRICAVPEVARLTRIQYRLSIRDGQSMFSGYWRNALELLKEHRHSVFVAHNLLISKDEVSQSEEAEFHFVTDRRASVDKGIPLEELGQVWEERLGQRLGDLALERGGQISGKATVTRPRGVGVPCFFSSNAKPGDGLGADAALKLCRTLEGHGFKPVNIDVASGAVGLREQVKDLVRACRFMVVLHCPEAKLHNPVTDEYGISDWVMFEESLMIGQDGEIIRFRFANVRQPAFDPGFIESRPISEAGVSEAHIEEFAERLERWMAIMYEQHADGVFAPDIPPHQLRRDLVSYYGGRG